MILGEKRNADFAISPSAVNTCAHQVQSIVQLSMLGPKRENSREVRAKADAAARAHGWIRGPLDEWSCEVAAVRWIGRKKPGRQKIKPTDQMSG
jgi:hypothetical protein